MDILDRIAELAYRYGKDIDVDAVDVDLLDEDMSDTELLNAALEQLDEEPIEDNELSYLEYKMFIEKR